MFGPGVTCYRRVDQYEQTVTLGRAHNRAHGSLINLGDHAGDTRDTKLQ